MKKYFSLVLVLLLIHETPAFHRAKRLIKGIDAKPEDLPYDVSIQPSDFNMHHCGGTIIDPYYVLTAAHCVEGWDTDAFKIVSGTVDLTKPTFITYVSEIHVSKDFSRGVPFRHDIALIKVTEPFPPIASITPATLPEEDEELACGKVLVSGFGRTTLTSDYSKKLKEAELYIQSLEYCKNEFKKESHNLDDTHICAYDPDGAAIWKGDSGSPLVCNNKVFGITINGLRDWTNHNYPSIFIKVSKYIPWIKNMTKTIPT